MNSPRPNVSVLSKSATEPSVGALIGKLAAETNTLMRHELKLMRVEMTAKAVYAGQQLAFLVLAGLLGTVSMLALSAALILGLGTFLPMWVSALAVGLSFIVVAALLGWKAVLALGKLKLTPQKTIRTFEETKSWLTQQVQ